MKVWLDLITDFPTGTIFFLIICFAVCLASYALLLTVRAFFSPKCEFCKKAQTREKNSSGQFMCSDCKLEEEAQREKKKKCPADGTTMDKEVVEELIIDRCPKCDSVWLDKGELEKIVDALEDEASSGRMDGMMTGIALGSAMHHR